MPTLAIDADLCQEVHRHFFPTTEFHEIRVERRAHVIQCGSTKNSKTSMLLDKGGEKRLAEIQGIVDRVSSHKNVLVIGAQGVTGNPSKKIPSKIAVPEKSALAHFNGYRGLDGFKNLDAVIVIGRNQPSPVGVENVARALWYDSIDPMTLNVPKLAQEPRGYRTSSGYRVGANVEVHPDPRVQLLLELIREAESMQGVDRLRLLHGKTKDVILLSNLVLDITVDHVVSWQEMVAGGTRLTKAWEQVDGVLPLSPDWLAKHFPDIFDNTDSAKDYLKTLGKEGGISNSITIRESPHLSVFDYWLVGQTGSPRRCVSKFSKLETKQRLSVLMHQEVKSITRAKG